MIQVCDIVMYDNRRWRVDNHLKRVDPVIKYDEDSIETISIETIINEILAKELAKEKKRRRRLGLPANHRYRLVYCRPEEATHLSLCGVCGAIVAIEEVERIGVVEWDEKTIEDAKESALRFIGLDGFPIWRWE